MRKYQYLIIGGGVAGTTAAETIRKIDSDGSIAIVEEEPYRFYSRVMLSKPSFFLGKIPFDKIWLKEEAWYENNDIDFLKDKETVALDVATKTVSLDGGEKLQYEKLLLAVGSHARHLESPGCEKQGVFYLRTLDEGKAIMDAIKTAKKAVVVGGGFIGFEMADLLRQADIDVTLVIRKSYYWEPTLDRISGEMIEKAMKAGGVKIIYSNEVQKVLGNDAVTGVTLKDGVQLECDMVVCGIGVVCGIDWVKEAGIEVNRGIIADEYLKTSASDIWTAGDIAEFNDLILEETVQLGNWVNAQEQGRIAAMNMLGKKEVFKFVSFYTTHGFELNIAFVGDARPIEDREVITRGSAKNGTYGRLLVDKHSELIGATLINRANEIQPIAKLIKSNIKVEDKKEQLADGGFDLKKLI